MYNINLTVDIDKYIDRINKDYQTKDTTEHSYRRALQDLLETIVNEGIRKESEKITIINEPKRKTYGAPDFEFRKNDNTIAFIETKDIGDNDIKGENPKKHKFQFDKYKNAVNTIAFTDYTKFYLYEKGEEVLSSELLKKEDDIFVITEDAQQISQFFDIIAKLGNSNPQPVTSANLLAEVMAAKAKVIADILNKAMVKEESEQTEEDEGLHSKLKAFRKFLVHDMKNEQFTDFYAQTILYGLFIARIKDKTPQTFSLQEAAELIPSTNPFLKKIFKLLALADLHSGVKWIVDDLVSIFKVTNVDRVLKNYGKDPIVHFYEDFLEKYNPKIREQFGVWYTPLDVVNFIVDSVDDILKNKLNIEDGLANNTKVSWKGKEMHRVQILDPATGTGTFLAVTAGRIYDSYKNQLGTWSEDVVNHIIPRLNGFEYLMAPYTMAHLKLSSSLHLDKIKEDLPDRLNIFLTNSLEEDHPEQRLDIAKFITDESNAASKIKRDTPVMVVMGNPPYNEKSANDNDWIMKLMDDYKQEPGMTRLRVKGKNGRAVYKNTLEEPNSKGINNDYCKFIRLGQKFVETTNEGVLAYICGNTFLDTRLFRGMRYELLKKFDEIYIINLHGSTKRKESTDERKDECVFDIMVGVSINIFVKYKNGDNTSLAKVYYKDLYGTRKEKLDYLSKNTLNSIDFEELSLSHPLYTFRLRDNVLRIKYDEGFKVDDLICSKVQGFKSDKDNVAIQYEKKEIENITNAMLSDAADEELRSRFGFKDNRDWSLAKGRILLRSLSNYQMYISKVQYRPFDIRWTLFHKSLVTYPRPLLQNSVHNRENFLLCLGKEGSTQGDNEWNIVYSSILPTDINMIPRGGVYLFPLFVYDETGKPSLNLSQEIVNKIEERIEKKLQTVDAKKREEGGFMALDLFDYIYAILHSTVYRKTYHECLQDGFPTIPYPQNADYFFDMADLGEKIRKLHQLEGIEKRDIVTSYPINLPTDNNLVTKKEYEVLDNGKGRIWINDKQYFDNVPEGVWQLFVSGYRPLDKWLDDKKGKKLTSDEIRHYQKIIVALQKQIDIMNEIDSIIDLSIDVSNDTPDLKQKTYAMAAEGLDEPEKD